MKTRKTRLLPAILVAAAAMACQPASAATVVCSGVVDVVAFHGNDVVLLKLSSMNLPVQVCTLNQDWNVQPGFTTFPATCKALLAMFMSAKVAGSTINSLYFDGPSVPAACNQWASWTSANVRYLEY